MITLVIIGVVATITIPTIYADWQKKHTVSRLLKVHSELAQTTFRAVADNGPIESWEVVDLTAREFYQIYLKPYLQILDDSNDIKFEYTALNGEKSAKTDGMAFYLSDGAKIFVHTPQNTVYGIQVKLYVDINGEQRPNRMARDIFTFNYWIYSPTEPAIIGKLIPWGANWTRDQVKNSSATYSCNRQKTGEICGALIAQDGWQISKDYPW